MVEVIAEIAQGYEGSAEMANLLAKGALNAGADAVKFQLVLADEICVIDYPYYNFFKSLEMDANVWMGLAELIHKEGKKLYFDVYGKESLRMAKQFGADGIKLSATDFYNTPLRRLAYKEFETVILSIGGATQKEIDFMLEGAKLKNNLILMHGFQAEPTEIPDNNLNRIKALKNLYPDLKIGFMDHAKGNVSEAFYLPLMAIATGAHVIEKHITLDYALQIEDFISALSVDRFKLFIENLRRMEPAMGSVDLSLTQKEKEYKSRASKVAVASRDIESKKYLCDEDISLKRVSVVASDLHIPRIEELLGKELKVSIKRDEPFLKTNIL